MFPSSLLGNLSKANFTPLLRRFLKYQSVKFSVAVDRIYGWKAKHKFITGFTAMYFSCISNKYLGHPSHVVCIINSAANLAVL